MAQPNYPYPGGEQPPAAGEYGTQYPGGVQYPGAMPPQPPTAPPPKKSNVGKIILIIAAVLVVLCGAGAAAVYFLVKDEVSAALNTKVTAPETLAGRPKITQPELAAMATSLETELKASVPNATGAVSGIYGDMLTQDIVVISAVSGAVADPAGLVDETVTGSGTDLQNVTEIDAGPLGGTAKCGDTSTSGQPIGVCVWADNGSQGMIMMLGKSSTEVASEFVEIRGQIETRE
jgi:hypothetical protein